jgi:hypothetical protein
MARAGSLLVDIAANTAKLQQDMTRANRIMGNFTQSVNRSFKTMGAVIVGYFSLRAIQAASRSAISFMHESIAAAGEEELAQKKLATALGYTSQALLDQATALQQVTAFGDDQIVSAQALIAAFTKSEDATMKATEATLDLAAGAGMNLKDAANLVSKTLGSTTNALSRYGITVEGAVGSTARLESFVKNVSKVFGGQARAEAETYTGKIKQVANAWGDLKEEVGRNITENTFVIKTLALVKETIEKMGKALVENKQAFRDFVKNAILFGVDALITFVDLADKARKAISSIAAIGIRAGFLYESINASQERTNQLWIIMEELLAENDKYAASWEKVGKELEDFRAKLQALKADQGKPDSVAPPPPPLGDVPKDAAEKTRKAYEEQFKAYAVYLDYMREKAEDTNAFIAELEKKRIEDDIEARAKLIVSGDDYEGTVEEQQEGVFQMYRDLRDKRLTLEQEFAKDFKDLAKDSFFALSDYIADFVTTGKFKFKDFINSAIADFTRLLVRWQMLQFATSLGFGEFFGFPVGKRASGGPVSAYTPYIVGESGRELFVPKVSGTIVPEAATPMQMQTPQNIKVEVINKSGVDVKATPGPMRFNFQESVVTVVLDAINRDAYGMRTALGR